MSKFFTILIILILVGAGYYIYDKNTKDVYKDIELLKSKYAITPYAQYDNIWEFSKALSNVQVDDYTKRNRIEFEKSYWRSLALSKKTEQYITNKENFFNSKCDDQEFLSIKRENTLAKTHLLEAKNTFESAKQEYKIVELEDWENNINYLDDRLKFNSEQFYYTCPQLI